MRVPEIVERTGMRANHVRAILAAYERATRPGVGRMGGGVFHVTSEFFAEVFGPIEQERIAEQQALAERILIEASAAARVRRAEAQHARAAAERQRELARQRADAMVAAAERASPRQRRRAPYRLRPLTPVGSVEEAAAIILRTTPKEAR